MEKKGWWSKYFQNPNEISLKNYSFISINNYNLHFLDDQKISIMSQVVSYTKSQNGSEKSFGLVFSFVFLIIAIYPLTVSSSINFFALMISLIFLVSAILFPKILVLPNKLWFKFGLFLGSIIAPFFMILVYITTVLPIGLIMRILGKDILKKDIDASIKSYWVERKIPIKSMKNQF